MSNVQVIPDGYHAITPHLVVRDVRKAIAFYKSAFGAEEISLHTMPDGKTVMHGEICIGNSRILMAEENPQWGCVSPLGLGGKSPVSLHLYVKDCDATFNQAVKAGATPAMPPADMFWGDRFSKVVDPFGHQWSIATHIKDMTEAEVAKAGAEFFAKMPPAHGKS
jgi:PhnB protein